MVELTYNGSRYMVDGGKWFRRLEVGDYCGAGAEVLEVDEEWVGTAFFGPIQSEWGHQYRVPCTDPRPPFIVGQRVNVARKDESWLGWYSDAQCLIGREAAVSDDEGDKLRITIVGHGHVYLPSWCLDAVEPEQDGYTSVPLEKVGEISVRFQEAVPMLPRVFESSLCETCPDPEVNR